MEIQHIICEDLGIINYKVAWDYQEELTKRNLEIKAAARKVERSQLHGCWKGKANTYNGNPVQPLGYYAWICIKRKYQP